MLLLETKLCLDEEIVKNEQDANVGAIFGIGFPPHLGGPCTYLNTIGNAVFAAQMTDLGKYGLRFML